MALAERANHGFSGTGQCSVSTSAGPRVAFVEAQDRVREPSLGRAQRGHYR